MEGTSKISCFSLISKFISFKPFILGSSNSIVIVFGIFLSLRCLSSRKSYKTIFKHGLLIKSYAVFCMIGVDYFMFRRFDWFILEQRQILINMLGLIAFILFILFISCSVFGHNFRLIFDFGRSLLLLGFLELFSLRHEILV